MSAVAEHAKDHHPIKWEESTVVNKALVVDPRELLLEEAIYILMIPAKEYLNRDRGMSFLNAALKKQEARTKQTNL